jgi:hypothetical protein
MPSKSSILAVLSLSFVFGCAPKNSSPFKGQPATKIEKGTKTTPQITSQFDQISLAFNELNWSRQTAALAIFPVSVSTQEGCVIRRPSKTNTFLSEVYHCTRTADESDSAVGQIHHLNGQQLYSSSNGLFTVNGVFASEIWQTNTLVSKGDSTRRTQISIPGGAVGTTQVNDAELKSSAFKMTSRTDYNGLAPEGRDAEKWQANITSGFVFSASKPLTLLTGSQVSLSYLAETDAGTKRAPQVVQITALSDISYVETENCLRPVGTFSLTNGSTQVGTLTTTGDGYMLSTETNVLHVWGKRCLER